MKEPATFYTKVLATAFLTHLYENFCCLHKIDAVTIQGEMMDFYEKIRRRAPLHQHDVGSPGAGARVQPPHQQHHPCRHGSLGHGHHQQLPQQNQKLEQTGTLQAHLGQVEADIQGGLHRLPTQCGCLKGESHSLWGTGGKPRVGKIKTKTRHRRQWRRRTQQHNDGLNDRIPRHHGCQSNKLWLHIWAVHGELHKYHQQQHHPGQHRQQITKVVDGTLPQK